MDTLRASMMMLGIVLHASITYIGGEPSNGWPLRDPSADSGFLLWLLQIIHNFRMPIFMLIAGFFAALLFYERSPAKMLRNRFDRLVLPFAVFVVLLWPLVILTFSYSNAIFEFDEPFESVIGTAFVSTTLGSFSEPGRWIPETTMHLWFVYYLILFSVTSFGLGMLFKRLPSASARIKQQVEKLLQSPIRKLLLFAFFTFLILYLMGDSWVSTSTSFIPDPETFVFYFFFYMSGWVIFKAKDHLETFMDHDWLMVLSGVVIFTISFHVEMFDELTELGALTNSVCVWLFIFGFTGLFMRYFNDHYAKLRYVSDSAYWVYLLHLPLTAGLPGLIGDWPVPGFVKFLFVVAMTVLVCFVTYHYFVRATVIGQFLNGRKYSRRLSDIRPTATATKKDRAAGLAEEASG